MCHLRRNHESARQQSTQRAFGPWASALEPAGVPSVGTFWSRRLAQLPNAYRAGPHASRLARTSLLVAALAVALLPTIAGTSGQLARADEAAEQDVTTANETAASVVHEYLPAPSKAEAAILAALERRTVLEFTETELADVVRYLREKHEIEIQWDIDALEGEYASLPEVKISGRVRGVSLRSALALLLPREATTLVADDALIVTTREKADRWIVTRTYPMADLLVASPDVAATYRDIVDALVSTLDQSTWKQQAGDKAKGEVVVVPAARSLVVSQTHAMHDEVLSLLRSLRLGRQLADDQAQVDPAAASRRMRMKLWNAVDGDTDVR